MRNYGVNDYLTPGSPHNGYSLVADQFGQQTNDNYYAGGNFGSASPTLLTGAAAHGYSQAATWSGGNSYTNVSNSYFFNAGDQRIIVKTTITALSNLTNLAFATSVDPDPDVYTYGSYSTDNQRGNSIYGIDDFVSGSGPRTGLTLAIVNLDTNGLHPHDAKSTIRVLLEHQPVRRAQPRRRRERPDERLQVKRRLSASIWPTRSVRSNAGNSVTLTYAYAVGDHVATTGGSGTPEPATWAMMLVGFGAVGATLRRRATKVTFA